MSIHSLNHIPRLGIIPFPWWGRWLYSSNNIFPFQTRLSPSWKWPRLQANGVGLGKNQRNGNGSTKIQQKCWRTQTTPEGSRTMVWHCCCRVAYFGEVSECHNRNEDRRICLVKVSPLWRATLRQMFARFMCCATSCSALHWCRYVNITCVINIG